MNAPTQVPGCGRRSLRLTMEPEPEATTSFEHAVEAAAQWHRNRFRLWQEEKQHTEPGLRPALLRLALASLLQPRLAEDARAGSEDLPGDVVGRVGAAVEGALRFCVLRCAGRAHQQGEFGTLFRHKFRHKFRQINLQPGRSEGCLGE